MLDGAKKTPQEKFDVIRWKRKSIPSNLKAGVLTRVAVRLPTEKITWLLDLASEQDVRWVKRLAIDPAQVLPKVDATIELFRVQDAI